MRRLLLVLIVGGIGALVPAIAAGAGPSVPPTSVQKTPLAVARPGDESAVPSVPDDTNTVGVQWDGDPNAEFRIDARTTDGAKWKKQGTLMTPDGGADPGSAEAVHAQARIGHQFSSEPLGVDDPADVKVEVTKGNVSNVRVVAVGSPAGFADTNPAPGPLDVNPLAAGGVTAAAAGMVSTRKNRKRGLILIIIVGMAASAAAIGVPDANAAPGDVPFPPNPGFVSRAQWGADENLRLQACPEGPDYADPKLIVLHHTATTNSYSPAQTAATVRGIYVYYIQGRGYCDHGYNFLVDRYGIIYEGRYGGVDRGVIGAHATNFNTGTIGIAMIGDFSNVGVPGPLFNATANLVAWKMSVHNMNPFVPVSFRGAILNRIIGHRDAGRISGDGTACPGNAGYVAVSQLIVATRGRVAYGWPQGGLDVARRQPGAIQVSGWTADPDAPTSPIRADVYVDGRGIGGTIANRTRTDVGRKYPQFGNNHGYSLTFPISPGPHTVCTYGISVGDGGNRQLGCRFLSGDTYGSLDRTQRRPGALVVRGWAIDPDTSNSVPIHVYVDGVGAAVGRANLVRNDVGSANPGYGNAHGFELTVPVTGNRGVCVYAISTLGKRNITLGCTRVSGNPRGSLDQARDASGTLRVRGWALDPDTDAPITVHVYVDGVGRAIHTANTLRPDIARAFPGFSDRHGFDFKVMPRPPGQHLVCVYGINQSLGSNALIGCKGIT